mmetsp:Transcript_89750/g.159542  ORF Transcript_89750/g.159542 Transcript_89750/m.159542 type:complete len:475 (+) Transcript_89750:87-1511(+)|eukprot:CAMPEP_0197646810 /NCGR_PEP_ID=MMETSP1338-20131121/23856_1 /TAXON_ID=43686 ORGANISM="Pelagodinium beii, Strain RCC1491" /NCGR_SAMPLE_ID=MMETSP1338 /ASSEMBLY_ACC=CAM_ASM_000754 /LENGTH=474 /DNA_ID=CAMNT_0043220475 /DNA_START=87 /DNA_END=1511 /DNA_ORIENTATION=-
MTVLLQSPEISQQTFRSMRRAAAIKRKDQLIMQLHLEKVSLSGEIVELQAQVAELTLQLQSWHEWQSFQKSAASTQEVLDHLWPQVQGATSCDCASQTDAVHATCSDEDCQADVTIVSILVTSNIPDVTPESSLRSRAPHSFTDPGVFDVSSRRDPGCTQSAQSLPSVSTPVSSAEMAESSDELQVISDETVSASIDIGDGVLASSPILHRYMTILSGDSSIRGHVFDLVPELAPLPEHVCVRFCSAGAPMGRAYQWFQHDPQHCCLSDSQGRKYTYSVDGPIVRSLSVAYILLHHRFGLDQHRHPTEQILQNVLCRERPENLEQCLRDMCVQQKTTSTSMLAYGILRSARCEHSPMWLEYLSSTCDFIAAARRAISQVSDDSDAAVIEAAVAVEPVAFEQSEFVRICRGALRGEKGYIAGRTKDGRWGIALLSGGCGFACTDDLERTKRPRRTKDSVICSMVETARSGCTAFL